MTFQYNHDTHSYHVDFEDLILVNAHCDNRVLHGPGECEYCDKYPEAQQQRMDLGVLFTGEIGPGQEQYGVGYYPCPAEHARGTESLYAWGGNQPHGEGVTDAQIEHYAEIERPVSQMFYGDTKQRHGYVEEEEVEEAFHLTWVNLLLQRFIDLGVVPDEDDLGIIDMVFNDMSDEDKIDLFSFLLVDLIQTEISFTKLAKAWLGGLNNYTAHIQQTIEEVRCDLA